MITVTPGTHDDFHNANEFVAASIREAFYRPDLTAEQVAENARIISIAERTAREAIDHPHRAVFVAKDDGILAGFVFVDRKNAAMPELDWLIVSPDYQGKGVAGRLMERALAWVGPGVPVQLGVIHFNARATRSIRSGVRGHRADRGAASDTAEADGASFGENAQWQGVLKLSFQSSIKLRAFVGWIVV